MVTFILAIVVATVVIFVAAAYLDQEE